MKKAIRIYQTPLILEDEDQSTYLLLTETEDYKPRRSYIIKVPLNIAHMQISEFEKRYSMICDN